VVGSGYVGLSMATLLAPTYPVTVIDVDKEKVAKINAGISPILDKEIEERLSSGTMNMVATDDISLCAGSDYTIISTPTDYDPVADEFDTRSVESVIGQVNTICPKTTIVIKSTIPIGYVERFYRLGLKNIIFSPEFLREGRALYDNLHPSRIIVGVPSKDKDLEKKAKKFAKILKKCSLKKDVEILITGSTEAESVKLFSNTYLAMRVSYFNELDTFAEVNGLDPKDIIAGVSSDPRIGDNYNNPSLGYGGYCLPKDTKQLLSNYRGIPERMISAIVGSNQTRKEFVAGQIMKNLGGQETVGIFRLIMKSGSDNFRGASMLDVMDLLKTHGVKMIIYEPVLEVSDYNDCTVVNDLQKFKAISDVIVANRMDAELDDVKQKVYTRDVFGRD
ncbi:MAG: nucleotide sugar dehydrogenase, partial [Methanomassiliicoccaceae archaeon]|nr:nucleotide sugar dehydrogenase [Methanomassiliicoccaceae archaeon]